LAIRSAGANGSSTAMPELGFKPTIPLFTIFRYSRPKPTIRSADRLHRGSFEL
jgi:hypothetical protein